MIEFWGDTEHGYNYQLIFNYPQFRYTLHVINDSFAGVVKVQGNTYGGGRLKYYLFEKYRAYLLKNIKNSWDFDHFWCFLDTKVKILPMFNINLKEILKFWHIFAHFCKKYANFWKFNARFWGRFIIYSPRNGADLFSICRITTPANNSKLAENRVKT